MQERRCGRTCKARKLELPGTKRTLMLPAMPTTSVMLPLLVGSVSSLDHCCLTQCPMTVSPALALAALQTSRSQSDAMAESSSPHVHAAGGLA